MVNNVPDILASLIDDNAVLAEISGAEFTLITQCCTSTMSIRLSKKIVPSLQLNMLTT